MKCPSVDVVTGSFGFIVRYVTTRLLSQGKSVRTLTNYPGHENPFGNQMSIAPLDFNDMPGLIESLRGADVLYNSRLIGYLVNDTPVTGDEVRGLMSNLLVSREPPTGHTRLDDWLEQNGDVVGKRYVSELARHYR